MIHFDFKTKKTVYIVSKILRVITPTHYMILECVEREALLLPSVTPFLRTLTGAVEPRVKLTLIAAM